MMMHRRVLLAAFCGGLVAGTLDIGVAALLNSVSPLVVLVFIASGILGKAAYHTGAAGLILGLALQWAMSFAIALIYGLGRERMEVLRRSWILAQLSQLACQNDNFQEFLGGKVRRSNGWIS